MYTRLEVFRLALLWWYLLFLLFCSIFVCNRVWLSACIWGVLWPCLIRIGPPPKTARSPAIPRAKTDRLADRIPLIGYFRIPTTDDGLPISIRQSTLPAVPRRCGTVLLCMVYGIRPLGRPPKTSTTRKQSRFVTDPCILKEHYIFRIQETRITFLETSINGDALFDSNV